MSDRLANAVASMKAGTANRAKQAFSLPDTRLHMRRREDAKLADARANKRFRKPENAAALIASLPAPGETLHAILRGDFVVGDMLPALMARIGFCEVLHVATLGLSVHNAETLRDLVRNRAVGRITLLCSHYFRTVEKLPVFHRLELILAGICEIRVSRCHAKLILAANRTGDHFVFETSANLRSSDSVEQMSVFNDRELFEFHEKWISEIRLWEPRKTLLNSGTQCESETGSQSVENQ